MSFQWENKIGFTSYNAITNIADAIRYKRSYTDNMYIEDMPNEINNIIGFPANSYAIFSDTLDTFVGAEVVDMSRAFCDHPGVTMRSGPNVVNMAYAYANCGALTGTLDIMQTFENEDMSASLVNGYMMFQGRDCSVPLYINVPENSAWNTWFRTSCTIYGDEPLKWTPVSEDYLWNSQTKTFLLGKIGNCVDLNHFVVNVNTTEFNVALLQSI